ncbi:MULTISPECIES: ABC transporter ATP-binding protein [Anaerotruncus]|uniref:ABC transporter ATP-binding protein n=1 Tax=Anaerotruncus TaxID=244127 RepID=UPI001FA9D9DB|nr:ABC transporter ATP-binding protein [Anaerotruncus massiliensis (ex Liu et al. 2021)]MCQ4896544.1 ABC transporter ATP-binding protein [Anaerotruncus sp. DFI.9.16]
MALVIKDLCVSYGKTAALLDVGIEVQDGQIVSIIGANGAGKTTLLNSITGCVPIQRGTITYNGEAVCSKPHKVVRQGIVQVPEGRRTFSGLTVEENLMVGAYLTKSRGEVAGMIEEMYVLFPRLKERRKQHAATLSGGEQQMLAIARGLMSKPKLLLLDEPSLGLAPLVVDSVFDTIRSISRSGITVLLIEQNAIKAMKLSDYCYVLKNGRVDIQGTGAALLANDQVLQAYLGKNRMEAEGNDPTEN